LGNATQEEVREALYEFQRYLLDQIAPLNALDAMETLIGEDPALTMRQIAAWAVDQGRIHDVPLTDCLFHALRKVHEFASLQLIEPPLVGAYLDRMTPLALEICAPEDRELLATHLKSMREMQGMGGGSAGTAVPSISMKKKAAPAPAPEAPADSMVARSARRLSLVIDRLTKLIPGRGTASTAPPQPAPQGTPAEAPGAPLVAMAATSSSSEQELEQYLQTLTPYTNGATSENIMRVLASAVPGWEIAPPPGADFTPSAPVEALHKIISMTRSSTDTSRRFRELLTSAVDQFNDDNLGAAVAMFELATMVIEEKNIDPSTVDRIRSDAVEQIKSEQLKKYAENKAKHVLLRRALTFFPSLTKESLLQQLRGEERPEKRRSLLGLLEAYGPGGRDAALAELEVELNRPAQEVDTYYLRNVIYLLHRIPRDPDTPFEKELELLTKSTERGQSIYVIKEAALPLGQIREDAAVRLLTTRMAEFEVMLTRSDTSLYPMDEMQKLLDRIAAALGRIATPSALLTIARHGMKANPLLGDTRSRLAVLSKHDLSFDEQTVNILIKAIRDDLPKKVLGRILPSRQPPPVKVIEALSSTKSEAVDALLAEIAEKFEGHEVAAAANEALKTRTSERQGQSDAAGVTLSGDLQFFGLPSLLQSLGETQATGIVTLTSVVTGQTAGKILVAQGKFLDAQAGHLRGIEALYQLLERPVIGAFAFVPHRGPLPATAKQPLDVMGILFEGIRRHDELKLAMTMVPDDVVLKATGAKPSPHEDEKDPTLLREVWVGATSGKPLAEWEPTITTDAFRIRRLVAHWVEQGALTAEPV